LTIYPGKAMVTAILPLEERRELTVTDVI